MNQVVTFPHEVIAFCNWVYCFVTFSILSSLLKLSVIVYVTGSIFKMSENKDFDSQSLEKSPTNGKWEVVSITGNDKASETSWSMK